MTNTNRFYDDDEVKNGYNDGTEVKKTKIMCRGHDGAPTEEQVNTFIAVCEAFRKVQPAGIIGKLFYFVYLFLFKKKQ